MTTHLDIIRRSLSTTESGRRALAVCEAAVHWSTDVEDDSAGERLEASVRVLLAEVKDESMGPPVKDCGHLVRDVQGDCDCDLDLGNNCDDCPLTRDPTERRTGRTQLTHLDAIRFVLQQTESGRRALAVLEQADRGTGYRPGAFPGVEAAHRRSLSPHEWTWTQREQEQMAVDCIDLMHRLNEINHAVANLRAEAGEAAAPVPVAAVPVDPDILATNSRTGGRRVWWSGGAWLYPGQSVAVIDAWSLGEAADARPTYPLLDGSQRCVACQHVDGAKTTPQWAECALHRRSMPPNSYCENFAPAREAAGARPEEPARPVCGYQWLDHRCALPAGHPGGHRCGHLIDTSEGMSECAETPPPAPRPEEPSSPVCVCGHAANEHSQGEGACYECDCLAWHRRSLPPATRPESAALPTEAETARIVVALRQCEADLLAARPEAATRACATCRNALTDGSLPPCDECENCAKWRPAEAAASCATCRYVGRSQLEAPCYGCHDQLAWEPAEEGGAK